MAKKSSKPITEKAFRTPIVAVMGHVDHGKTTLLDSLRGSRVVDTEAGGITQNTRAHQITTSRGHKITFIDTPGHEAFSQMRSRGAQVTDFVLLVVAADDGLQPQTIESIKFAQESKTPIIVALNKIDLEVKSLDKIKKQLADYGVVIEEYGGDTLLFPVSALKKQGLDELIEGIELLAELHELKQHQLPHPKVTAAAFVLESLSSKQLGPVALCLLKAGQLGQREIGFSAEQTFRVRATLDEYYKPLSSVSESDPFWVSGLKQPLTTGETIYFTREEKAVSDLAPVLFAQETQQSEQNLMAEMDATDLIGQIFNDEASEVDAPKYLNVIIRASTQGTLEAVVNELSKLETDTAKLRILEMGVGEATEKDVERVKLAKGIVLTFQQPVPRKTAELAKRERVIVRNYEIIYEMIDEVFAVLSGLNEPESYEEEVARAQVKQVFTLSDGEVVAGSIVTKGNIIKGYDVWIERKDKEIGRAKIASLKHFKEEVREVKKGLECGIILSPKFEDLQTGDFIVAYKVEKA